MKLHRLLIALLSLCGGGSAGAELPPGYTRASFAGVSTQDLARRLLGADRAARVERHTIAEPFFTGGPLWGVYFYLRPEAVDDDVCMQLVAFVDFQTIEPSDEVTRSRDAPTRVNEVRYFRRYALAAQCAELPGRRFALPLGTNLSEEEAVAILRRLAVAQSSAAAAGPLPFRLRCENGSRRHFSCPADMREVLATLPLHQAFTVERQPFPSNCDHSARDEGDAVEIGDPSEGDIWDVRLRHWETERAEIVLIRQFPRTRVEC